MVVEQAGSEISEARHGIAALELIENETPDVVVADMRMPLMNGVELVGRLRAKTTTASIPIVLLSGLLPDPEVSRLVDAVVAKPFEPAHLLASVRGSLNAADGG